MRLEHRTMMRPGVLWLGMIALLAVVAFLLRADEARVGTAEAATDGAAMRLSVNGESGKVSVFVGETFTVLIEIDAIPLTDGYTAVKAWTHYGDELGDQTANGAVKSFAPIWPDMEGCSFSLTNTDQGGDARLDSIKFCGSTGVFTPPFPASHYKGPLFSFGLTCPESPSSHFLELIPFGQSPANEFGTQITVTTKAGDNIITPSVQSIDVNCVEKLAKPGDTDGDGCPDVHENRPKSEANRGGGRDWEDPNDYFDVYGPGQSLTLDGVIDLPNDILGVIQHFAPLGAPPYDVRFDRGVQIGPNHWQRAAPDGVIDLPNDILGVISQVGHNCV